MRLQCRLPIHRWTSPTRDRPEFTGKHQDTSHRSYLLTPPPSFQVILDVLVPRQTRLIRCRCAFRMVLSATPHGSTREDNSRTAPSWHIINTRTFRRPILLMLMARPNQPSPPAARSASLATPVVCLCQHNTGTCNSVTPTLTFGHSFMVSIPQYAWPLTL